MTGARVGAEIGDDEQARSRQGMGADRLLNGRLVRVEADPRLEPLAIAADEADERDRRPADFRSEADDVVVADFGRSVEDVQTAQDVKTRRVGHLARKYVRWRHNGGEDGHGCDHGGRGDVGTSGQ